MSEEETDTPPDSVLPAEMPESSDSNQLLNFTQRLRREFVREMVQTGLPTEKEDRQFFLQTLRDMDNTAIQRSKLDIDQESLNQDRYIQEAVQKLRELAPRGMRSEEPVRESLPQVNEEALPDEYLEGELTVGLSNETHESFLQRMESGE